MDTLQKNNTPKTQQLDSTKREAEKIRKTELKLKQVLRKLDGGTPIRKLPA